MYPSQSRPITLPLDVSTIGDNVVITNPAENNQALYIKQVMLMPAGTVTIKFKAVNNLTGAERDLTSDPEYAPGQGFIQESFDAQFPYIFEINKGENFVIELGGAVACKGYLNYSINNQI